MSFFTRCRILFLCTVLFSFSPAVFAKPKVALVLGGGGARGIAEIALIEELEERGIVPDIVIGTSMGSLIGALYSAGYTPKQLKETLLSLDFLDILNESPQVVEHIPPEAFTYRTDSIGSVAFSSSGIGSAPGLIGDQKILSELNNHLSRVLAVSDFDKFPIPYRATGTYLSTGDAFVYDSGSIVQAVRGSMSIPTMFVPSINNGRFIVDGGVRNNVPLKTARDLGADIVIAMDVMSIVETPESDLKSLSAVTLQVFNLAMSFDAREQHKYGDLVLIPDLKGYSIMDFVKAKEILAQGEKCVMENMAIFDEVAEKLQALGYEFHDLDYNRESVYNQMEDPIIEKISIKDVSIDAKASLPKVRKFSKYIGRRFDDKMKRKLAEELKRYRKKHHLSAIYYALVPGSSEDSVEIELRGYDFDLYSNKVFLGGNSSIEFHSHQFNKNHLLVSPDVTVGAYFVDPVNAMFRITLSPIYLFDGVVYSGFYDLFNLGINFRTELGGTLKYGALEVDSTILNPDQDEIAQDNGFAGYFGLNLYFSDFVNMRIGGSYEYNYLKYREEEKFLFYGYLESVLSNMSKDISQLRGTEIQILARSGVSKNSPDNSVMVSFDQRVEIVPEKNGIGFEGVYSFNRFPSNLTCGYADFGGFNGMSGLPSGSYKRDFVWTGLAFRQKLVNFFGMPVTLLVNGKIGLCDNFNPFESENPPNSGYFNGVEDFSDVYMGGGIYFAMKLLKGTVTAGCSLNNKLDFTALINFR